jgi:hypothetical protein
MLGFVPAGKLIFFVPTSIDIAEPPEESEPASPVDPDVLDEPHATSVVAARTAPRTETDRLVDMTNSLG